MDGKVLHEVPPRKEVLRGEEAYEGDSAKETGVPYDGNGVPGDRDKGGKKKEVYRQAKNKEKVVLYNIS